MSDLYTHTPTIIVAYTTPFCPDCIRARHFFNKYDIEFLEVNINKDFKAADFVTQVNQGLRSVPTIIFPDGDIMVEPSNDDLARKLIPAKKTLSKKLAAG